MKYSFNGLDDYPEIRAALIKDVQLLFNAVMSETGHMGDILSSLRTAQQSIELKCKKIQEIREEQKNS